MALRSLLIIPMAAVLALAFALPAAAAPDNKNTVSFPVECGGGIPDTQVFVNGHSSSDVVFLASGRVLVAKNISGTEHTTLTVEGGPTFDFTDSFEEGANGGGYAGKLFSCGFVLSFEDDFQASKRFIADFDLDPSLIGANVHVSSAISGAAQVLMPGK